MELADGFTPLLVVTVLSRGCKVSVQVTKDIGDVYCCGDRDTIGVHEERSGLSCFAQRGYLRQNSFEPTFDLIDVTGFVRSAEPEPISNATKQTDLLTALDSAIASSASGVNRLSDIVSV